MYKRALNIRLWAVFIGYLVLFLIIISRLVYIQLYNHDDYKKLAENQHHSLQTLPAQRGQIFDRNMKVLAMSVNVFSVYACPRAMTDKSAAADALSRILDIPAQRLLEKLQRDRAFVWIKRRIPDDQSQEIIEAAIPQVGLRKESRRYYPDGMLAAHIVGFSNVDGQGLEGIELKYNNFLQGFAGKRMLLRDAKQRVLPAFEYKYTPPQDGMNVVLTIDEVVQHIVEEELDRYFTEQSANAAWVVVMDPRNGDILALANRPAYDLNAPAQSVAAAWRNRAVCDVFEPGSTFKIITAAAALEENKVSLDEVFFCENGQYRIGSHILHDHKPYGNLTFPEVIQYSSNIGTVKIAQKLGKDTLYGYIRKFGFGQRTEVDLPGEVPGILRPAAQWSKLSMSAIPIGQEVAVTALQMARALAVIANDGSLVRPHVFERIIDPDGKTVLEVDRIVPQPVLSRSTCQTMRRILRTVVDEGTGKRAALTGYSACGKTGTAQKVLPSGGYSHRNFVASFIGFAPAEDARVVIAVIVDDPKPLYYGGLVAAPIFKRIGERVLKYLQVPPTEHEVETVGTGISHAAE